MKDYSNISDEELLKAAGMGVGGGGVSTLSDADLYKIAGIDSTPQPMPKPTGLQSTVRGVQQGASFGFGDEIKSGIGAAVAKVFGGEATNDQSLGQLYDEALASERGKDKLAAETNPISYYAGDIAGGVALPVGAIKNAKTVGQLAGVGVGAGLIQGVGRSESENAQGLITDAAIGGAVGGVLTPAVSKAAGAASNLFRSNSTKAGATLEPDIGSASLRMNSNANTDEINSLLSNASDDVVKRFNAGVEAGLAPEESLIRAQAEKFGVRLSIGDITQNVSKQAEEDLALKGVYGQRAESQVRAFRDAQQQDLANLGENVSSSISGRAISNTNESDIADSIAQRLKMSAKEDKGVASAAYDTAKNLKAYAPIEVVKELPTALRKTLQEQQFDIESMPSVSKRLTEAERFMKGAEINNFTGVSLNTMENFRKRIVNSAVSSDAERTALGIMKRTYDSFSDDIIDQGLLKGTDDALSQIKEARGLWAAYKQKYYGADGKAVIGKVIDNDYTPEQTMQLLIGSGKIGAKKDAAKTVQQLKNILGENSEEFLQLKQAGFARLFGNNLQSILNGGNIEKAIVGGKYAQNVDDFLRTNDSLAEVLFKPDELNLIKNSARIAAQATTRQPGAVNQSGTAPGILRVVNQILERIPLVGKYASGLTNKAVAPIINAGKESSIAQSLRGDIPRNLNDIPSFSKVLGEKAGILAVDAEGNFVPVGSANIPSATVPAYVPVQSEPLPPPSNNGGGQSRIENSIDSAAELTGIESDLLRSIAKRESGFNAAAKNPNSTATGVFQITAPTWNQMVDKYGDSVGVKKGDIKDPEANVLIGALLTRENSIKLKSVLKRQPTPGEVYMAHFLGSSGALKLIKHNQSDITAARLFPAAAKANKNIFFSGRKPKTAKELYRSLSNI